MSPYFVRQMEPEGFYCYRVASHGCHLVYRSTNGTLEAQELSEVVDRAGIPTRIVGCVLVEPITRLRMAASFAVIGPEN